MGESSVKIRIKLILLVAVLTVAVVFTGSLSTFQLNHTKNAYKEMQENEELQLVLKSIQYRFTGISNDERAYLLTGDTELVAVKWNKKWINQYEILTSMQEVRIFC